MARSDSASPAQLQGVEGLDAGTMAPTIGSPPFLRGATNRTAKGMAGEGSISLESKRFANPSGPLFNGGVPRDAPASSASPTTSAVPCWLSANRDLCEGCWALREGARAKGGTKCPRCGRRHRRGFALSGGKDAMGRVVELDDGGSIGPVPWQRFRQVPWPAKLTFEVMRRPKTTLLCARHRFHCLAHRRGGVSGTTFRRPKRQETM